MPVEFRGWGRNRATLLLVLIAALVASGVLTVQPLIERGGGARAEAATWPCQPHGWQYAWHTDSDTGFGWGIQQHYQLKDNGCDVFMVSGTHSCQPLASLTFSISTTDCSSIRRQVTSAYGEYIVVRSAFTFSPWLSIGFVHWQHFLCRWYDAEGRPMGSQFAGPTDSAARWCLYQ